MRTDKSTHVFNHAQDWNFCFFTEGNFSSDVRHGNTLEIKNDNISNDKCFKNYINYQVLSISVY